MLLRETSDKTGYKRLIFTPLVIDCRPLYDLADKDGNFLPGANCKIIFAIPDTATSIAKMGTLSVELNRPMQLDANPPIPICRKPSSAEAVPTLLVKGAKASADPFG